jgi:hypothetical protein
MRTCAQHEIEPLPYLASVLRKLAGGWDPDRLEELLPDRWHVLHRDGSTDQRLQHTRDGPLPVTV